MRAAEGRRLARLLGQRGAGAARRTWDMTLYDPPDVAGWDFGTELVLDRRDARAHEFRLDARGESAVQPGRRAASAATQRRPNRCWRTCSSRCARRRSTAAVASELVRLSDARPAPGPAADAQLQEKVAGPRSPGGGSAGVPVRMKITRRQFVKGGVAAFTVTFAAPEFLSRPRARAGGARPQPRRAVSERRQRRAQHADPVQRSVLLQPPADAGRAGRQRAADRHRLVARRARPASAADRSQADLRCRAVSRSSSGPATRTRAARISSAPTSGRRPIRRTRRASAGSAAISIRCPRRSIRCRLEHDARPAARAAVGARAGAGDPERRRSTRSRARTAAPRPPAERNAAVRINSHVPVDRPELAFVYGSAQAALATLDRVATVAIVRAAR